MKKVLFIQNSLLHYRIPFYNYLQKEYGNITVCHFGNPIEDSDINFKEIIVPDRIYKGFHFPKKLKKICSEFDIIVGMFDLRWPAIWTLPLRLQKYQKFYFWGIGVSTERGLDKVKKMDPFRFAIAKLARGLIFYSNYPVEKYIAAGFEEQSLFVANNTIYSSSTPLLENISLSKFLFFGSLTQRKRIDFLINSFNQALVELPDFIILEIVGEGPEKQNILDLIKSLNLEDKVFVSGPVYNEKLKKECFQDAIATISPGQAGLSVLESFAFGVPFITKRDAITGGEIFNIQDRKTGFFVKDEKELSQIMITLALNRSMQNFMKKNCLDFYRNERQISHMGKGFLKAFNF